MDKTTQVTQGTWRAITLVLFSVAIFWGVLGLSFGVAPTGDPTKEIEQANFWMVRGCLFGLAFSFGFLGYSAYLASRRKEYPINARNVLAVLGVALGIVGALLPEGKEQRAYYIRNDGTLKRLKTKADYQSVKFPGRVIYGTAAYPYRPDPIL